MLIKWELKKLVFLEFLGRFWLDPGHRGVIRRGMTGSSGCRANNSSRVPRGDAGVEKLAPGGRLWGAPTGWPLGARAWERYRK